MLKSFRIATKSCVVVFSAAVYGCHKIVNIKILFFLTTSRPRPTFGAEIVTKKLKCEFPQFHDQHAADENCVMRLKALVLLLSGF